MSGAIGGVSGSRPLSAPQVAVAGKQLDEVRKQGQQQAQLIEAAKPPSGDGRGRIVNRYA